MLSCKEVAKILASGEKLSLKKKISLSMHLFMCKHCSRYSRQLHIIKKAAAVFFKKKVAVEKEVIEKLEKEVLVNLKRK